MAAHYNTPCVFSCSPFSSVYFICSVGRDGLEILHWFTMQKVSDSRPTGSSGNFSAYISDKV